MEPLGRSVPTRWHASHRFALQQWPSDRTQWASMIFAGGVLRARGHLHARDVQEDHLKTACDSSRLRPLHMLFTEPIVGFVSLYCGFIFALIYAFVVSVPWIFTHYYGIEEPNASLSFLGPIFGTLGASIPLVLIDVYYYQPRLLRWQAEHGAETLLPSEHRLIGAMAGSFLLPFFLFASAWTAASRVHWIAPVIFQGCVMFTSILVYSSASLFMLDSYGPLYGASASGAMMMSRYVLSTAFPLFTLQMYKALGVGWGTSLLGFVALAMAPIPWCFWVYGEGIRKRSRYENSS
ncbi:hypothetical protein NLG97_g8435 [Lecanicillium saksenae]|uniref:Uncharacterized protein n=1 Tax=Lecanicillium saksenae TaxID=468837 RepID=A0ACC1QMS8_9HYPO|nr:hypothetical protein NLG97_g8435 [Lecanicillium saksenae]